MGKQISRRTALAQSALSGLGLVGLGALSGRLDLARAFAAGEGTTIGSPALIGGAKKEGHLNLITLPRDWANYGEIMDTFHARYGSAITDAIPDGSSAQEIAAIKNLKGQNRAPDAVDVGPAWAQVGATGGLFAPYKVATWDTIPGNMKDPTGLWYGDYYGIPAFMSVHSLVKEPLTDWSDLLSPKLKNMVALGGDPRQAGEAFGAVFAAALANGGSLDNIEPGINFFAKLKKVGNWNPTFALNANIAKGATPVAIRWDYLLLAARDVFNGNPAVTVTVPKTGHYAGYYCQAISTYAPNPEAARLWEEFLYSDEGQLLWLKGYTHPARYGDLAKRGQIPQALADKLPSPELYKDVKFATAAQINAAQKVLVAQWGPKVAGN
jgi:putative spermidine/putrescine transport system substrate-binding protein